MNLRVQNLNSRIVQLQLLTELQTDVLLKLSSSTNLKYLILF